MDDDATGSRSRWSPLLPHHRPCSRCEWAADAVRALGLSIKQESVILGEPTDRTALSIEDTIRREYERWMVVAETEAEEEPLDDPGEA